MPTVRAVGRMCRTNLPSNTAFRAFGRPQSTLRRERSVARLANRRTRARASRHAAVRDVDCAHRRSVRPGAGCRAGAELLPRGTAARRRARRCAVRCAGALLTDGRPRAGRSDAFPSAVDRLPCSAPVARAVRARRRCGAVCAGGRVQCAQPLAQARSRVRSDQGDDDVAAHGVPSRLTRTPAGAVAARTQRTSTALPLPRST